MVYSWIFCVGKEVGKVTSKFSVKTPCLRISMVLNFCSKLSMKIQSSIKVVVLFKVCTFSSLARILASFAHFAMKRISQWMAKLNIRITEHVYDELVRLSGTLYYCSLTADSDDRFHEAVQ